MHLDKLTKTPPSLPQIERGARHGGHISQKLFTAAIDEVFQISNLQNGIEIEGESVTDLRGRYNTHYVQKT